MQRPLRSIASLGWLALAGCSTFAPSNAPPSREAPRQSALASVPERNLLAVAEDGRVRLLDGETGDTLAETSERHAEGFVESTLSPDGARIALTTWSQRLVLYERAGAELRLLAELAPQGHPAHPRFGRDGALAAIRRDHVVVWPDGDVRRAPVVLQVGVGATDLAFRPSDGHLGVAFADRVETWSVTPPRRSGVHRDRAAQHVAFAPNGRMAAGSSKIVVVAPDGAERPLDGPSGCEHLAWDGAGEVVACHASRDVWICERAGCEALETGERERPWSMLAPAANGFFLSRGDGRVVHRVGRGRERAILTDGIVVRRSAPR